MQLFGFNLDLAGLQLRLSIRLDDRTDAASVRVEDMPRLELMRN